MAAESSYPQLLHIVLDCTDARLLAEFYRQFLGLVYRPGDEISEAGRDEPAPDWLVLLTRSGERCLAFQQVADLPATTWPEPGVPQQVHLDTTVPNLAELNIQDERALALGARLVLDRTDDLDEPLRVCADPAGHVSCIFVA